MPSDAPTGGRPPPRLLAAAAQDAGVAALEPYERQLSFAALSYAGTLTISIITDPDHVRDQRQRVGGHIPGAGNP